MSRLGEIEGVILREDNEHDVRIADLAAYVYDAEEGGYWAEVPVLPGCLTQGETLDEIVTNLDEAIRGWLASQSLDDLKAQNVPFTVILKSADEKKSDASTGHRLIRSLEFAA